MASSHVFKEDIILSTKDTVDINEIKFVSRLDCVFKSPYPWKMNVYIHLPIRMWIMKHKPMVGLYICLCVFVLILFMS